MRTCTRRVLCLRPAASKTIFTWRLPAVLVIACRTSKASLGAALRAASAIFTPSDIGFKRDAIAAECPANIETVIFEDLDLELLKRHRQSGSVLNWQDRRTDLYEVRYLQKPPPAG